MYKIFMHKTSSDEFDKKESFNGSFLLTSALIRVMTNFFKQQQTEYRSNSA